MPVEVVMPKLGWATEAARLVEWVIGDGDPVEAGDVLFIAEGDKAAQEVEAFDGGTLCIAPAGQNFEQAVPVGTVLGYLVQPGETFSLDAVSEPAVVSASVQERQTPAPAAVGPSPDSGGPDLVRRRDKPAISPRAARVAAELGVDWTGLEGSGRTGRIVERDVRRAAEGAPKVEQIKATPVARRLAEAEQIDLTELAARRQGQRIVREDVEDLIAARDAQAPPAVGTAAPTSHIRQIIARRMVESSLATAALTLTTEADATELVTMRDRLKATLAPRGMVVPTYNDLMVKLTAVALAQHPQLNAYWADDTIMVHEAIHIATAVDTEAGLLVPVIRDVLVKSVQQIAVEARDLAEKARSGGLMADSLQGGTFTITNLGMYGIDAFTPIINLPGQCAILGVGRIVKKPAAWQDQVALRGMMALSLTFDHRAVDGGPAARFLNTVREFVEQPYLWLTG